MCNLCYSLLTLASLSLLFLTLLGKTGVVTGGWKASILSATLATLCLTLPSLILMVYLTLTGVNYSWSLL